LSGFSFRFKKNIFIKSNSQHDPINQFQALLDLKKKPLNRAAHDILAKKIKKWELSVN